MAVGRREALRPDTTLAPGARPEEEVYVRELPACCLASLKAAVVVAGRSEERRLPGLGCGCGREWRVTSSLDERVLGRFVTYGEPVSRAGSTRRPSGAGR